ncbi:MAG: hypothetical protein IJ341_08040 [Bacteroidales bacterium]|nr:hypothetical protein [Bacteroidales bacterium]
MGYKKEKLQLGWEFSAKDVEFYHLTLQRVREWSEKKFPKKKKRYGRRLD